MKKIYSVIIILVCFSIQANAQKIDSVRIMEMRQWNVNHYAKVYQTARGLNDLPAAKEALLNILVEVPTNDSILFELGKIYFQMQQYGPAVVVMEDIIKSYPDQLTALEMAAVSYENLNATREAVDKYEKLYLESGSANILYKLVLLQYELERFGEALTNINALMTNPEIETNMVPLLTTDNSQKEYPFKALLLNLRGLIKIGQNNNEGAKADFQESLKIAPDFASAKEHLNNIK